MNKKVIRENPYLDPDYRDRLLRLFPTDQKEPPVEPTPSLESDKGEACNKIAAIISSLCGKYGLAPLNLRLGIKPDFQNGGTRWDGSVHLTIGS